MRQMEKFIYNIENGKREFDVDNQPLITVTPRMIRESEAIMLSACHYGCNELHSYGLFNPYLNKYKDCFSLSADRLLHPLLPDTHPDHLKRIQELTHPSDFKNIANIKSYFYPIILNYRFADPKNFRLIFLRRMLDQNMKYIAYVQNVTIAVCDEDGYAYELLITSDRNPMLDNESEEFYRQFNFFPHIFQNDLPKACFCLKNILTDVQFEIVKLISMGYKKKEIAEKLFISELTYETHCDNIRLRLHINNINKVKIFFPEHKNQIVKKMNHIEMSIQKNK
jgi:DNA-binding CsgD family transcriptional regulator